MMQHAAPSYGSTYCLRCVLHQRLAKLTDVGLHMNFVSCWVIFGAANTCSTDHPSRNWEYGLFTECLWFLLAGDTVH